MIYIKYLSYHIILKKMNTCQAVLFEDTTKKCPYVKHDNSIFCAIHSRFENVQIFRYPESNDDYTIEKIKTCTNMVSSLMKPDDRNEEECIIENDVNSIIDNNIMIKTLLLKKYTSYDENNDIRGPACGDVTRIDNQEDPINYEQFWTIVDGKKIALIDPNLVFSYYDDDVIRGLHVLTIKLLFDMDPIKDPNTGKSFSKDVSLRAKRLINMLTKSFDFFSIDDEKLTIMKLDAFALQFFKKFHTFSIYISNKWLRDIKNIDNLTVVLNRFDKLVKQNLKVKDIPEMNKDYDEDYLLENIHNMIKLMSFVYDKVVDMKQTLAWIIVESLAQVSPDVYKKYPDVKKMFI